MLWVNLHFFKKSEILVFGKVQTTQATRCIGVSVRGVSWSEVATVPKRKSHRGLDLDLSLNFEVNIRKSWKENGGTR